MELLLVRHGKAGDASEWVDSGKSDELRPLTEKGEAEFRRVASKLVELAPDLEKVFSSPLKRAVQTAEILADRYGIKKVEIVDELRPWTDISAFESWLSKQNPLHKLALVGHEPHMSSIATYLTSGQAHPHLFFKKGGAAYLTTESRPAKGAFLLNWLIQPKLFT